MATKTKSAASSGTTGRAKKDSVKKQGSGSGSSAGSKKKAAQSKGGSGKERATKAGSSTAGGAPKTAAKSGGSTSRKSADQKATAATKTATSKGKTSSNKGADAKRSAAGGSRSSSKSTSSSSAGKQSKSTGKSTSSSGTSGSAKSAKSAASTRKKGTIEQVSDAVASLLPGGQRNVLDLLKEDHQRVDAHFKKVKAAEDANHEAVFKKIKAELDLHAHVEESIFYPRLMKTGSAELEKIVREGVEEHAQVKTLLAELSELRGTDKVFKAKLKVLIENVEHHVEEEENEMFPLVEDELGEKELVALAERVEKEKAKIGDSKPPSSKKRTGGK